MTVSEAQFRAALLDPEAPVPTGLIAPDGTPAGARYSVYRNNVVVSLCEALSVAFPLVSGLLGAENFHAISTIYVRRYPPASQLMMHYGEQFPDFLRSFEPLAHLGYLADCARLDLALRRSYHAADCAPLDAGELQVSPEDLAGLHLRPAPATEVLRSPWPLFDLWRYTLQTDAPKPRTEAQDVMVTRPEFDPLPILLPTGAAALFEAMSQGMTLGQAHDATLRETPDFDLSGALTLALQNKALSTLKKDTTT